MLSVTFHNAKSPEAWTEAIKSPATIKCRISDDGQVKHCKTMVEAEAHAATLAHRSGCPIGVKADGQGETQFAYVPVPVAAGA